MTDLLQAALAAGGRLLSWSARAVDHRPAHSTTVSYSARVAWADGERAETLGASTGLGTVEECPPGVIAVSDGERQVAVWRFPLDPALPALASAYDADAVSGLFASYGLPSASVRFRTLAYRPGRRAVLEATTSGATLFLKVMRPRRVAGMHERHRLLHDAGVRWRAAWVGTATASSSSRRWRARRCAPSSANALAARPPARTLSPCSAASPTPSAPSRAGWDGATTWGTSPT